MKRIKRITRRKVLRNGAIATGIGLSGLVGTAGAHHPANGGMAMIASSVREDYDPGDKFTIDLKLGEDDRWAPTDIDTACDDTTNVESFWPYIITNQHGKNGRYLFFPVDKDVKIGDRLHVFHNVEEGCSKLDDGRYWQKIRVKPA